MADGQLGDEKDSKECMDVFPVDETPTPTRILKLANDLFPDIQDPSKENPFDAHFRKAAEAVNQGSLTAGVSSSTEACTDDSLNTPSIFPSSALNTPTPIKSTSSHSNGERRPTIKPQKCLKPLLPNTKSIRTSTKKKDCEDAQLLLKTANGQTFKLFNVPVVPPLQVSNNSEPLHQPSTSAAASTSISPKSKSKNVAAHPEKDAELRERNRYSARRSRKRKQKYFDDLTKSQKDLALENKMLRAEVLKLKGLLDQHENCNVTLMNKSQDIRDIIGQHGLNQEDENNGNENANSNEVDNEMDEVESVDYLHDNEDRGISTLVCDMSGEPIQMSSGSDVYNYHNLPKNDQVHHIHDSTGSVLYPAQNLDIVIHSPQTYIRRKIYNDFHSTVHHDKVHTSAIVRERDCYQSVVNDNVQVYTPIAPRPPPQTVAEDLTTNKVSSASELKRSSSRTADRKSSESLYKPGKRNGSLGQKLKDIKDKMNQDRHIDEFLIQISDARSNALKDY